MSEKTGDKPLRVRMPIGIDYKWCAGPASTDYLTGLKDGRLFGRRCPVCELVYFPPRNGVCARDGVMLGESVEVGPKGTISTFCIVNVPFLGQTIKLPYVAATIILDGAHLGFSHLIQECEANEVRMGMRVEPVWRDKAEWDYSLENILYFKPSGEPDAPFDDYERHL